MKTLVALCLALAACSAFAQVTPPRNATVFQKLDDSPTGWGSCSDCAGGATVAGTYWMAPYQTTPSRDGDSTQFYISGPAYSNALWWNKLGPHNNFSNFQTDFWVYFDSNTAVYGQAFEFDTFQFTKGREFMFGTQCDYAVNLWEVWNQQSGRWVQTSIPCPKFQTGVWYHITWQFHRGQKDRNMYYDYLSVEQYAADGKTIASSKSYALNLVYPSGPLPVGWDEDFGVQFQMDINGTGGTLTEWIDSVTLTAW